MVGVWSVACGLNSLATLCVGFINAPEFILLLLLEHVKYSGISTNVHSEFESAGVYFGWQCSINSVWLALIYPLEINLKWQYGRYILS